MTPLVLGVQLAWWTQVLACSLLLALLLPGVAVAAALVRSWSNPFPAVLRAAHLEDLLPDGVDAQALDASAALGVGAVVASFVVLPVTPHVAVSDPSLGVFVLPLLAGVGLVADAVGARALGRIGVARARLRVRLGGLVCLALAALAVAAQWGSASLRDAGLRQLHGEVAGVRAWGLPTLLVQPVAFVAALVGIHLLTARGPVGLPDDRLTAGLRGALPGFVDLALVLAGSAWVSVAFLGGAGVPWTTSTGGVVVVFGVGLLVVKVAVVSAGLRWAEGRWPHHDAALVERAVWTLLTPALAAGVGAALLGRAWL